MNRTPLEKFNDELNRTVEIFQQKAISPQNFGRKLGRLGLEVVNASKGAPDAAQKFREALLLIEGTILKLRSGDKLNAAGLEDILNGINAASKKGFDEINKTTENALKKQQEILSRAKTRTEGLRTPAEKFADELRNINEEIAAGALTPEVATRRSRRRRGIHQDHNRGGEAQ